MKTKMIAAAMAASLAFALPQAASAQDEFPLRGAEYVEVTSIYVDDGHMLDYANHLARAWRTSQDYAMEQGWITGYEILMNVHARSDEPDLYLLTRFTEWTDSEEGERRGRQYRAHVQSTIAQLQAASGARADYRRIGSTLLLQNMSFRD